MAELSLGVVGLGVMGNAIAARLTRQGFPLMVFDLSGEALRFFVMKNQADIALSPRMMAESCASVIAVLPSAAALRETVFGKEGLASAALPGLALINMGAPLADPRAFAGELAARGIALLDAPLCGTPVDAKAGRLVIPVSGESSEVERHMPVFRALGEKVTHTGPIGSGRVVAALADYLRAATMLALGEALLLAGRQGIAIAPTSFLDFCKSLDLLAPAAEAALHLPAAARSLAAAHTLGTLIDNLDAALALAAANNLDLPFIAACRESWAAMQRDLGAEADHAAVVRWIESAMAAGKCDGGENTW